MAPVIKHKICNIYALPELSTFGITEEDMDLDIPMFIAEHDMSLHGLRYFNLWNLSTLDDVQATYKSQTKAEIFLGYVKISLL